MLGARNVRLAIVGNKLDLLVAPNEARAIQMSPIIREAIQLTEELQNARHYLTSAKLNQGLGELFVSLSRRMIEQHKRLNGADSSRNGARPSLLGSRLNRSTVALGAGALGAPSERDTQTGSISGDNNRNNSSCRC